MKRTGLNKKENTNMLELIKEGYTAKEISNMMNVLEVYVITNQEAMQEAQNGALDETLVESNTNTPIVDNTTVEAKYASMTDEELNTTPLKELRQFVKDNIDSTIANNSTRAKVIKLIRGE